MVLICIANIEKVYIFGESYSMQMKLYTNNVLSRPTISVLFTVLSIHVFQIVLLLVL